MLLEFRLHEFRLTWQISLKKIQINIAKKSTTLKGLKQSLLWTISFQTNHGDIITNESFTAIAEIKDAMPQTSLIYLFHASFHFFIYQKITAVIFNFHENIRPLLA